MRVLVVDDAPEVAEMLAVLLRQAGHDASVVHSASEALEAARARAFDIVISDVMMPARDGYELVGDLRALPDYGEVPIIAVSGFGAQIDKEKALEAGFDALLAKPIDPSEFLSLVASLRRSG